MRDGAAAEHVADHFKSSASDGRHHVQPALATVTYNMTVLSSSPQILAGQRLAL
jgi:hypothetical protein